jgi:hypothetical protein
MSRVQLALNVPDIDDAIADTPLKLVLFEKAGADARLNHLGVEVPSSDDVWAHQSRLNDAGIDPLEENGTCCFAKQDKVWVDGPDGAWEIYAVLADRDGFGESSAKVDDQTGDLRYCSSVPEAEARCCG